MATYIVCEGDSLTVGNGIAAWSTYPLQFALLYTDNRMVSVVNVATAGNKLSDIASQAATEVDACYDVRKGDNITVVWCGTNSMYLGESGDFSGATAYGLLVTYCQDRQAAGEKVVVVNCLPRQNVGTPAGFEAQRVIFNASIAANWATFADALADVAADARLSDPTDGTYFDADKVHLIAAGNAVIASIVKAAVDSL
jgi:lysophospholipase L1-like esterase